MPKISVVLPVYNVAEYIYDTVQSLLQQTFKDFEIILLDDCSTDDTVSRIADIIDPRLKIIRNTRNLGRAGTDNAAIPHVSGEYIAKMDGDDICHPERLARQLAYLENNSASNVVGSWVQNFGASSYLNKYPLTPDATKIRTLFTMPVGNPTLMFRAEVFVKEGLSYDENLRQTEDYDFLARYIRQLHIGTIPEALLRYRMPHKETKEIILTERAAVADKVRAKLLTSWGMQYTEDELHIHNISSTFGRSLEKFSLSEVEEWLQRLLTYNEKNPLFSPVAMKQEISERWFEMCYTHQQPALKSIKVFRQSSLARDIHLTKKQQIKFLVKSFKEIF